MVLISWPIANTLGQNEPYVLVTQRQYPTVNACGVDADSMNELLDVNVEHFECRKIEGK